MQTGEQRKDTLLFPEGPTGQFRDHIADAEEFQSLSSHGISRSLDNVSMGESSRKKKVGFYSTFIQLFIVVTSLPSERSPVFYHSLPGCDLDFSLQ